MAALPLEVKTALRAGPFAGLTEDSAARLFQGGVFAEFPGGTELHQPGDPLRVALILSGAVRIYHQAPNAKQLTICRLRAGQAVGLTIAGDPGTDFAVQAANTVRLWALPAEDFRQRLFASPEAARATLAELGRLLAHVARAWAAFAFAPIEERIVRYLDDCAPADAFVHLPQQALADEIGATREATARALKRLQESGAIEKTRAGIKLLARPPETL